MKKTMKKMLAASAACIIMSGGFIGSSARVLAEQYYGWYDGNGDKPPFNLYLTPKTKNVRETKTVVYCFNRQYKYPEPWDKVYTNTNPNMLQFKLPEYEEKEGNDELFRTNNSAIKVAKPLAALVTVLRNGYPNVPGNGVTQRATQLAVWYFTDGLTDIGQFSLTSDEERVYKELIEKGNTASKNGGALDRTLNFYSYIKGTGHYKDGYQNLLGSTPIPIDNSKKNKCQCTKVDLMQTRDGVKIIIYIDSNGNNKYDSTEEKIKEEVIKHGLNGQRGPKGEEGKPGVPGPQGIPGPKGEDGKPGERGERGPAGPQGPRGDKGERGPAGPQGPRGENGKDGAPGRDGQDGKDGQPGPQGPRGENGKDGAPGRDGQDGKDGQPGPQGPRGENGKDGAPGRDGQDGKDGQPGPQGPRGENGKDGAPGRDGQDGKDGQPGPQGERGEQGPQGERGEQGPQGERGEQGPKGERGEQGPQGERGEQGSKGERGEQGPKGERGEQGPKGERGEQGPRGENHTPTPDPMPQPMPDPAPKPMDPKPESKPEPKPAPQSGAKPQKPTKPSTITSQPSDKALPKTNDTGSLMTAFGTGLLSLLGLGFLTRRKRKQ
ncbi:thioester-forming surface-anchored protein [Streptococcus equi]|uniref:thioester-forming surface-anchored protein n=1 Tax=Streptococcus equi TaxID=1336 RepID=UPI001E2DEB51|nr:thioester-forming surface-anchored protein [Streptococcus equi]MCD3441695.1 thioester-forming surface-anchored protein [Streptococcus equi subsp. zooepidemicus]